MQLLNQSELSFHQLNKQRELSLASRLPWLREGEFEKLNDFFFTKQRNPNVRKHK